MIKISLISIGPRGGMAHYISGLANGLSKHTKVTVVVADYLDKEYFNKDIKIINIKTGKNHKEVLLNSFNVFNFYKIWKIFQKLDGDVVHFVSPHPWNFLISFFCKQPIVYTSHDPKSHLGENPIVAFFYQLMINRAKKIIVHSKIHREYLLKKGFSEKKVFQIQHGDYSFLTKYQKPEIKEENNILFFGRIEKYKGIEYLLEAFYLVQKEISGVKLVIAGQGDLSLYDNLIKKSFNIQILNYFIPDAQIAELFQKAKLTVLPYTEATQSGVISIAYAFKKPVVATLVGGLPELVEDGKTGYLVKPFDSHALAQAIIKILEDDETRKKMGENGFEKMKKELSWDKIAGKTVEVYKNLIIHENGLKNFIDLVSYRQREKKLKDFINIFKPTEKDKVLDLGVNNKEYYRSDNFFIKYYPFQEAITALGLGCLDEFKKYYPKVETLAYDGKHIPFSNKYFNISHSNAVLEHVGEEVDQVAFVKELSRVSKKVFIFTPNKFFPVETHTKVFFIHWLPNSIFRKIFILLGNKWIKRNYLNVLSFQKFKRILDQANIKNYKIIKNKFLGLTITFSAYWINE